MRRSARWGIVPAVCLMLAAAQGFAQPPNVVLVMTDDQGYGDLGVHDNPILKTPNLDAFAGQSARFNRFYVSPVCAPTRASLMTGRYNYRTGVTDTYLGRAMMHPREITVAEALRRAGYATGIFGKWHLGDNYPLRAMDQGFSVSVVHKGGGITQPSDPPEGSSYFDSVVYRNGVESRTKGYCSDVFTDAALQFIRDNRGQPFFAYLSFNAPHSPFDVTDAYADPYRELGMTLDDFPNPGHAVDAGFDAETMSRVYGMITNIDDNMGRLLRTLDELGLSDNTIVIFLTDNGPATPRYNAGLRGRKGTVFEGGIRVPFYMRWPAKIEAPWAVDIPAAHIDVMPTLLDACGVELPPGVKLDGRSLMPLLSDAPTTWPERTLFFQWHRGDAAERYRAFTAVGSRYKLAQPEGVAPGSAFDGRNMLLFDLADPYERDNLAVHYPEIVRDMRGKYDAWFDDVTRERGFEPVRIAIGAPQENPVWLTRQDWRGPRANWGRDGLGHWELDAYAAGNYDIKIFFPPDLKEINTVWFKLSDASHETRIRPDDPTITFENVPVHAGHTRLEVEIRAASGTVGPHYVELTRRSE